MEDLRVLELFSGIGGMHYALKHSGISGEVIAAVDINHVANKVYSHNHPKIELLNNNIQKLSVKSITRMNVNTILMSPPCQPFTRVGNQRDVDDSRTDALKHLCETIGNLTGVDKILMENVKGFEESRAHDLYLQCLKNSGYDYREFILSPTQFGVPNTRHRYFCIARRSKPFDFSRQGKIEIALPNRSGFSSATSVKDFLEPENTQFEQFLLPDDILRKRAWVLDIVTPDDRNTMCFTKAYTHYCEGTGSVFTSKPRKDVDDVFAKVKELGGESSQGLGLLQSLKLKYFSPKEVSRLMSFPPEFTFPDETTNRQRYRLLGNSINVLVVSELIKILCS